jgi:AcrR family transcriptional regulator
MRRVPVTERHSKERRALRAGRPPRRLAGEVDARILDAACRLFFERGLEGTSVDEIASLARAGKRSIYARFPSNEALFTAVVLRTLLARASSTSKAMRRPERAPRSASRAWAQTS